jgi:hypothetical protein
MTMARAIVLFDSPPRQSRRQGVGRPIGSKAHFECRYFLENLLSADKNHDKGTLREVLNLVKKYLPIISRREIERASPPRGRIGQI